MAENRDAVSVFHYAIEVGGAIKGYFTSCSGLGSEHEVIEHKVTDDRGREIIQKTPGRMKWDNISLERGITDSMDIWDWRKLVEDGKMDKARKNGSIVMFNSELAEVGRWDFERGWPSKVTGPDLKSDSNAIGVEKLTIVHEGMKRKN
ncbi:MAG: phage tail protein [Chloroflexi bacterium]|nr:phage tail protein [Chloroflexota bacterium]